MGPPNWLVCCELRWNVFLGPKLTTEKHPWSSLVDYPASCWPSIYFDDWLLDNSIYSYQKWFMGEPPNPTMGEPGSPVHLWRPNHRTPRRRTPPLRCFPSRKPLAGAGRGWDGISRDGVDTQGTGGVCTWQMETKQASIILTKLKRFWLYIPILGGPYLSHLLTRYSKPHN